MNKILLFLLVTAGIFINNTAFSQTSVSLNNTGDAGEITGIVRNSETGHVVPNISVIILKDGNLITGTVADEKGRFRVEQLEAGTYDLKIAGSEFHDKINNGIVVLANKVTHLGPQLTEIDFKRQCLCIFKTDWTPYMDTPRRTTESSWIPEHIIKQSLGF